MKKITVTIDVQDPPNHNDRQILTFDPTENRIDFAKRVMEAIEEMQNPLRMTTSHAGIAFLRTEGDRPVLPNRDVPIGTTVTYLGHTAGGVRVRFDDGTDGVMHPSCFPFAGARLR